MSGEVASREAQAAVVLDQHDGCHPSHHAPMWECRCGKLLDGPDNLTAHQARMLYGAGLLAPPPGPWQYGTVHPERPGAVRPWPSLDRAKRVAGPNGFVDRDRLVGDRIVVVRRHQDVLIDGGPWEPFDG